MHSLGTLLLSFALVASQTWAASINVHPVRVARLIQVPRTLQDPESFKRSNLDARDGAGFSPFERKDLFPRQSCTDTEVTCLENKCCPDGFDCYYYTGGVGCCPTGNTCTGPPTGCADPNAYECPASIGGCCPNGQACYVDSTGVARCDSAGIYSTSAAGYVTPTTYALPTVTTTLATVLPNTPVVIATPSTTIGASVANTNVPAIVTVTTKSGAERNAKMATGALVLMVAAFVRFA